jgi:hypothetical protein
VGDTLGERTRRAFDSDDSFFSSVGCGQADLYTFKTLDEAAHSAKDKIEAITAIERSMDTNPADETGSLKMTPIAVPNLGRRRKRAWSLVFNGLAIYGSSKNRCCKPKITTRWPAQVGGGERR